MHGVWAGCQPLSTAVRPVAALLRDFENADGPGTEGADG